MDAAEHHAESPQHHHVQPSGPDVAVGPRGLIPVRVTRVRRVTQDVTDEQVVFVLPEDLPEHGDGWRKALSEDRWLAYDREDVEPPSDETIQAVTDRPIRA